MQPNMINIVPVFFFLIVLLLSGCNGSGGGSAGESDPDDNGNGGGSNGSATVLEGEWKYCLESSQGDSDSTTLVFNGNTFTEEVIRHSDADCVTANSTLSSFAGTFAIGNSVTTKNGLDVKEIDMLYSGNFAGQNQTRYDIFYIQSSTLYTGLPTTENNLLSPATRPDEINFSVPFDEQ